MERNGLTFDKTLSSKPLTRSVLLDAWATLRKYKGLQGRFVI